MAKSAGSKAVEELTYEQALTELEEIVAKLEGGENPLQESMQLYERGQALVKRCSQLLEEAELKVRKISGQELVPFEAEN